MLLYILTLFRNFFLKKVMVGHIVKKDPMLRGGGNVGRFFLQGDK